VIAAAPIEKKNRTSIPCPPSAMLWCSAMTISTKQAKGGQSFLSDHFRPLHFSVLLRLSVEEIVQIDILPQPRKQCGQITVEKIPV
jgi:hypothetical protein